MVWPGDETPKYDVFSTLVMSRSLLTLIIFQLIFILLGLSNLRYLFGITYTFEDILSFPWILIFNLTEGVSMQGAKNDVWKGSIIIAKL